MATLTSLCIGCVAAGSAMGTLSVRGRLATETGAPLPNHEVQLILPAEYGLGGLDRILNHPEDFGHADRRFSTTSDADGAFHLDLGQTVYHAAIWILPPLGAYPRQPPAPLLLLRLPDVPNEHYAIQTWDGIYRVFTLDGTEVPSSQSRVSRLTARVEAGPAADLPSTVAIVEILIRLE